MKKFISYVISSETLQLKSFFLVTFLIVSWQLTGFAYANDFSIDDIKIPEEGKSHFPEISSKIHPKIAEKINTSLQMELLKHLPNKFKRSPLETVTHGDPENIGYHLYFHSYESAEYKNILTISMSFESCGAYCEFVTRHVNFDISTGKRILLKELFTGLGKKALERKIRVINMKLLGDFIAKAKKRIKESSADYQKDKQWYDDQLDMYEVCYAMHKDELFYKLEEYTSFLLLKDEILIIHGRCSNHAMRSLEDIGEFETRFSYTEIMPYSTEFGKSIVRNK